MSIQETLIITKDNLLKGLDKAISDYRLVALTDKSDGHAAYDFIKSSSQIQLKCRPTTLPPKKFFFPQDETLLEYTSDGKVAAKIEAFPMVLFGIRPCDLNGIKILNEAFADDHGDPNYIARKEMAVVIGMDCIEVCDKEAFCFKVNTHNARGGFDMMLYEIDNGYAIEIANDKGEKFVEKYFATTKGDGKEIADYKKRKAASFSKEKQFSKLDQFPELFERNKVHPIWDQEGSRCLSCGSCIMVCPTCYCFDVVDSYELNMKQGKRFRKWDACMLSSFAAIGSGENFRPSATSRLHHRINRKFNYLMKKHGHAACVGCGRCVRACLVDISPKVIAAAISGEKE